MDLWQLVAGVPQEEEEVVRDDGEGSGGILRKVGAETVGGLAVWFSTVVLCLGSRWQS